MYREPGSDASLEEQLDKVTSENCKLRDQLQCLFDQYAMLPFSEDVDPCRKCGRKPSDGYPIHRDYCRAESGWFEKKPERFKRFCTRCNATWFERTKDAP